MSSAWLGGLVFGEGAMAIPVVGPFIEMSKVQRDADGASGWGGLLLMDGLVQVAGVTMLIAGIATRHPVTVYERGDVKVSVAPTASMASAGLGAVGTF
jgi:hypothetical protein